MSSSTPSLDHQHHVVVGAGATGTATAELAAARGARVTVVTRSGSGPDHASIERIAADATDTEALTRIADGASAIYNCANPPYHTWPTDWPPLADALLGAAAATGATLVTLSNLYGHGRGTSPMRATDPLDPPSKKGRIRSDMWHQALAAHERGQVHAVEVRAGDFIGPGVGETGHMGDRVVPRVIKGSSIKVVGDPDQPHSWTAIADVARTLVAVSTDEQAWGRAWFAPTGPALTQRQLIHRMCELAGVPPVKVSSIPGVFLRLGGVFVPAIREMGEIMYQFTEPFVIDTQETAARLGLEPTPLDETLRAVLASYGHQPTLAVG